MTLELENIAELRFFQSVGWNILKFSNYYLYVSVCQSSGGNLVGMGEDVFRLYFDGIMRHEGDLQKQHLICCVWQNVLHSISRFLFFFFSPKLQL